MRFWQRIQSGFRALFRKEKLDQEMDDEMRFHLELQTRENIEAGMEPEEARYAALRGEWHLQSAQDFLVQSLTTGCLRAVLNIKSPAQSVQFFQE